MTDPEVGRALRIRRFAESIARLKTEAETSGGYIWEDASTELNQAVLEAREVTGIDPKYEQIFCTNCLIDRCECSCGEEESEDEPR